MAKLSNVFVGSNLGSLYIESNWAHELGHAAAWLQLGAESCSLEVGKFVNGEMVASKCEVAGDFEDAVETMDYIYAVVAGAAFQVCWMMSMEVRFVEGMGFRDFWKLAAALAGDREQFRWGMEDLMGFDEDEVLRDAFVRACRLYKELGGTDWVESKRGLFYEEETRWSGFLTDESYL